MPLNDLHAPALGDTDGDDSKQKADTVAPGDGTEPPKAGTDTSDDDHHNSERFTKLKQMINKPKVEETHTRRTFLVQNDLSKRLDDIASGNHGFITKFINLAIKIALDEVEIEIETKDKTK